MRDEHQYGISLSGGGARGVIHLGVLQAFEDHQFTPTAIAGTSMGAAIGALYSAGISPREIFEYISQKRVISYINIELLRGGVFKLKFLSNALDKFLPHNDFGKLEKKLFVCATNLSKGHYHIFSDGDDLKKAVMASCSMPVLFRPVEINGDKYVDGGLLNNMPVEPLKKICKEVIGVHVNQLPPDHDPDTVRTVSASVFNIVIKQNVLPRLRKFDYLIEPKLNTFYDILDFDKSQELYDIGYQEGLQFLEQINKRTRKAG